MAIDIPKSAKVYTTKYESFKGVDYTSDATNVWRRRSPSGINMLPDSSGAPYTRTGWQTMATIDRMKKLLEKAQESDSSIAVPDDMMINRCFYFELAGKDHIMIFTNGGIFRWMADELSYVEGSSDADCYSSVDRAFFFEGDGKSAFYIYGNRKVWVYEYVDNAFRLSLAEPYAPTVLVSTDPSTCGGTTLEGFNLLGDSAKVQYTGNSMFYHYVTGEFNYTLDKDTFTAKLTSNGIYEFIRNGSNWTLNSANVTLSDYGIAVIGTAKNEDKIVVIHTYGVLLPQNVAQDRVGDVEVYVSSSKQFDTKLNVVMSDYEPTSNRCVLKTDLESIPKEDRRAFILFDEGYLALVSGEDAILVTYPVTEVTTTDYDEATPSNVVITLNGTKGGITDGN